MLELKHISKTYTQGKLDVPVLKNVSFAIEQGEYVAIMGPSGSGKTTLMNIIGCLDYPTYGQYLIDGEDVSEYNEAKLADVRLNSIGFVFQSFHLLSRQSALANVELPLVYAGVKKREREEIAKAALARVSLSDRMDFKPNQLSGGQSQRVAIARAIANNPRIILADEPTGALDSKSGKQIMDIFQQLNDEGVTVIMITHDNEIAQYAKRVLRIRDGRLVDAKGNFLEPEYAEGQEIVEVNEELSLEDAAPKKPSFKPSKPDDSEENSTEDESQEGTDEKDEPAEAPPVTAREAAEFLAQPIETKNTGAFKKLSSLFAGKKKNTTAKPDEQADEASQASAEPKEKPAQPESPKENAPSNEKKAQPADKSAIFNPDKDSSVEKHKETEKREKKADAPEAKPADFVEPTNNPKVTAEPQDTASSKTEKSSTPVIDEQKSSEPASAPPVTESVDEAIENVAPPATPSVEQADEPAVDSKIKKQESIFNPDLRGDEPSFSALLNHRTIKSAEETSRAISTTAEPVAEDKPKETPNEIEKKSGSLKEPLKIDLSSPFSKEAEDKPSKHSPSEDSKGGDK